MLRILQIIHSTNLLFSEAEAEKKIVEDKFHKWVTKAVYSAGEKGWMMIAGKFLLEDKPVEKFHIYLGIPDTKMNYLADHASLQRVYGTPVPLSKNKGEDMGDPVIMSKFPEEMPSEIVSLSKNK